MQPFGRSVFFGGGRRVEGARGSSPRTKTIPLTIRLGGPPISNVDPRVSAKGENRTPDQGLMSPLLYL